MTVRRISKPDAPCSVPGCERPYKTRGMCGSHAERDRRGAPMDGPMMDIAERFMMKVDRRSPSECWLWTAHCTPLGYGQFRISRPISRLVYAHRFSYELHRGPIPEGLVLDHLCRVPSW